MSTGSIFRSSTALLLTVTFFHFGPPLLARECAQSPESSANLTGMIEATHSVVERTSSCGAALSASDKKHILKMRAQLLTLSKKTKAGPKQSKAMARIIAAHEKDLSPAATAAILREAVQIRRRAIQKTLDSDIALAHSLQDFEKVAAQYTGNRNSFLGGILGVEKDDRVLNQAAANLKKAIAGSRLDDDSRKLLIIGMNRMLSGVHQNASKRALDAADMASLGILTSGSILSLDLIFISYLSLFTPIGKVAGTAAKVAVPSAGAAAGLAGFAGADGLGRLIGYAAMQKGDGSDFTCRLVEQINSQDKQILKNALKTAILGGGLGGGIAGAAKVSVAAARAITAGATGLFALNSGQAALESHQEAERLESAAKKARLRGDLAAALDLENQARRAKVDTTASGIGAMLALGGSVTALKISRAPVIAAGKSKAACPTLPKKARAAGAAAASAGAAASLSGCGGGGGDSGTSDGNQDTGGTPPVDPGTRPGDVSCAQTNSCVVRLSWKAPVDASGNPEPVSGYKIYWGPSPGLYSNSIDVGNQTQAQIPNLGAGTYYFAATAYLGTAESGFSNEVSKAFGAPETSAQANRVIIGQDGAIQAEPVN